MELEDLITQVKASLNNRPLSYQGEDIETALTPAQLTYGYDLPEIAEQELEEEYLEIDVHKRTRYMQKMKEHLWNRWENEYLTPLREFHKMGKSVALQITEGELVLVSSKDYHSKWKLDQMEKLILSQDGIIIGAKVRVSTDADLKVLERLLQLLYPLEIRPQFETKVGQEALIDQIVHPKRSTRNAAIDGKKAAKKMINEMDQGSDAFDQGSVLRIQKSKFGT